MHYWSEAYITWIQKIEVDLLRIADACAGCVIIAPSRTKHSSGDLRVFAARPFQKSKVTGS